MSHIKVGDALAAQGNLTGALESYRASLSIDERLFSNDPGNSSWQYNLSISNERIGDVRLAEGNLPGALEAYGESLAIAKQLIGLRHR